MANKIQIDVNVDDKGTTKKVGLNAKKLGNELEGASKSVGTLDRNLKGAAGATSNATKGFAKMAQGMGGLVSVYAAVAANVFALSAAFEFLKRAAEVKMLEDAQQQFAANTGQALASVTASLREASQGMLGFREAAQAAAIGVAKGFSPQQLERLAKSAGRAAAALGRDFQDAFDRLVRGVSKAEPELLDELGITLRLEKATKEYATALGIQADSLTDVQRSQAVLLNTQKQLDAIFGTGPAPENKFIKLGKTFEDILKTITQFLLPVLEYFADLLNRSALAAITVFGAFTASVIGTIMPMEKLRENLASWKTEQQTTLKQAIADQDAYTASLERSNDAQRKARVAAGTQVQKGAGAAVQAGSSSVLLQQVAQGGLESLTKAGQATLKRAIDAGLKNVDDAGKITKGIFKGVSEEVANDMKAGFLQIDKAAKNTEGRLKISFKNIGTAAKLGANIVQTAYVTAFTAAANASLKLVEAMNKLLRFAALIGMLSMLKDIVMDIFRFLDNIDKKYNDIINNFIGFKLFTGRPFKKIVEKDDWNKAVQAQADEAAKSIENYTKDATSYLEGLGEANKRMAEAFEARNMEAASNISSQKALAALTIISQLPTSKILQQISEIKDEELKTEQLEKLKPVLESLAKSVPTPEFKKLYDNFAKTGEITPEFIAAMEKLGIKAGTATASFKDFTDKLGKTNEALSAGDLTTAIVHFDELVNAADNTNKQFKELSRSVNVLEKLEGLLQNDSRTAKEFLADLKALNAEIERGLDRQSELTIKAAKDAETGTYAERAKNKLINEYNQKYENAAQQGRILKQLQEESITLSGVDLANKNKQIAAQKRVVNEAANEFLIADETLDNKKALLDVEEKIRAAKFDQQMLNNEKTLLDLTEKRLEYQKELLSIKQREAELKIEGSLRQERRDNMFAFLDEEKRAAEARYQMELDLKDEKIAFIESERQTKLEMINLEYALLEAKMIQSREELKALALKDELKPEEQARANELANQIDAARSNLAAMGQSGQRVIDEQANLAIKEVLNDLDKLKEAKDDLQDINVITDTIAQGLASGLGEALNSIVQGTSSVKDAFGNMALSILQELSTIIARMLIVQAIGAAMGMFAGPRAASLTNATINRTTGVATTSLGKTIQIDAPTLSSAPGKRYGGVVSNGKNMPGYATGGIASGSQAGYPVMMHGTEAVVPLPNGRSIPVEMSGSGTNNVSVNVNVSGSGTAETSMQSDNKQAGNLGKAIAMAVQEELQRQKRPGGILSPYGAA